jgi:hypothetical protein
MCFLRSVRFRVGWEGALEKETVAEPWAMRGGDGGTAVVLAGAPRVEVRVW